MGEHRRTDRRNSDMATMLSAVGSRLLAAATTLRGLVHERGDEGSDEGRVERGLAADMEDAVRVLDLVKDALCPVCRMVEVETRVEVGRGEPEEAPPALRGRRRKRK